MLKKHILFLLLAFHFISKSQCPQVYNYLGVLSNNPYWISCTGTNYLLNFQSNSSWSAYTIDWGDGTPLHNAVSYVANSNITHNYNATVDTFVVTLTIPAQSCTLTGVVVMEQPAVAGIQIPIGGVTQACAPATLQFINSSTNVSKTTKFTWSFGDGSTPAVYSYTNGGQTLSHLYASGSVNCQTVVTIQAQNYCNFGSPSTASINPIKIFDKDVATVLPSSVFKCWPANTYTFTNNSSTNCTAAGNNFQRKEYWNFGNYWGLGHDSIFSWNSWPPSTPRVISFPSVGTYTVMLRDSNLCGVSQVVQTIAMLNSPSASVAAASNTVCQNASISFTNASSPGFFYRWNFGAGGGFVAGPLGSQTFTYNTPGTYTVSVVAYFPGGGSCSDTSRVIVTVVPLPVVSFTYAPNYGCSSLSNVTFTNSTSGATSWNWNLGNGNTSTLSIPPPQSYTVSGNYIVSLQASTVGCVSTKTAAITVYTPPTASFTPLSSCINTAVSFTNNSFASPTNTIVSQSWNFGDGSPLSFVLNPVHTFSASGSFNVKLVVNSAFCKDSIIQSFTVHPQPQFTIGINPNAGCHPFTVNFPPIPGSFNHNWNFGDGGTSVSASPVHTFTNITLANITYTTSLIASDINGCLDTAFIFPVVFAKPQAGFTYTPTSGCSPLPVNFFNTSSLAAANNWDFGNGNLATGVNASQTFTTSSSSSNTVYNIELLIFSPDGCRDSITKSVTVFPQPDAIFSVNTSACSGSAVTFTNNSSGAISYNWNFGNSQTSTVFNPVLTYTNTGTVPQNYTVQLVVQNTQLCLDTAKLPITIYPKPDFVIKAVPDSGCANLSVNFPAISGAATCNWNFGNGNAATSLNPSAVFSNTASVNASYTVQLIAADANGCKDTSYKQIKVFPKPTASFEITPMTVFIPGQSISCNNLSTPAVSYYWLFGDGNNSSEMNPVYEYKNEGDYQVTLIVTDSKGCKDTFGLQDKVMVLEESSVTIPNAFTPNINGPSESGVYSKTDLSNDIFYPVVRGVDPARYEFIIYSRWGEVLFATKETIKGWDGYYKGKLCQQDVYIWKVKAITLDGKIIEKTGNVTLIVK